MKIIKAQFSGNAKEYHYDVTHFLEADVPQPGDRLVVPNKLKDDGDLSLTIVTVSGTVEEIDPSTTLAPTTLLPAISRLEKKLIADYAGIVKGIQAGVAA
jgi:hypothetical protein